MLLRDDGSGKNGNGGRIETSLPSFGPHLAPWYVNSVTVYEYTPSLSNSNRIEMIDVHSTDKNLHQQELAEETFKQIRSAYEVLSDPNERAWYVASPHIITLIGLY